MDLTRFKTIEDLTTKRPMCPPVPDYVMDEQKRRRWLEALNRCGWNPAVAGQDTVKLVLEAIAEMLRSGKGLLLSGKFGVGKTRLMKALCRCTNRPTFFINLAIAEEIDKFTSYYQEFYAIDAMKSYVFIDDMGKESHQNEYGEVHEYAEEFVVKYHLHGEGRLFITTNYTLEDFDKRYGGRLTSRLKDLVVPVRLEGKDKRKWSLPNMRK